MTWEYWIQRFTRTHCTARGLRPLTIIAYEAALRQFYAFARVSLGAKSPDEMTARDVLIYVQHLRNDRGNGDAAVNRLVAILKVFYRAMVAMGYLQHDSNPMLSFPTMKATPRKLPVTLTPGEVKKLLSLPPDDTVLGLRDRALLALLYGTGIRASECANLADSDVDLEAMTVTVDGKGGHQRTVPLNAQVVNVLVNYRNQRGLVMPNTAFFRCRNGQPMKRRTIYERVRTWGVRAHLDKRISPHRLRHTFASHLMRAGVGLVTLRDLLGHKQITSTQIYLHVTAQDLREAADKHPIAKLINTVDHLLPNIQLPIQYAPRKREYG